MKTRQFIYMKSFPILIAGFFLIGSILTACRKNDNSGNGSSQMYTTTGNASGAQQDPPNSSSGSGTLNGTFNSATNVWQYNISWNNLTTAATVIEVRGPASVGLSGALLFTLAITVSGTNGSASGNVVLTAQQEADLLANKCYYSIPSSTYITGEIRGQILATLN